MEAHYIHEARCIVQQVRKVFHPKVFYLMGKQLRVQMFPRGFAEGVLGMRKQFKVFLVTLVVVGSRPQPRLDLYKKMMKSSAMSAYFVGGYMLNDGGLDV